jgi:hypothetical protein
VDSDGEYTEAQKCGFGELNRYLGGGRQVGYHGSIRNQVSENYTPAIDSISRPNPSLTDCCYLSPNVILFVVICRKDGAGAQVLGDTENNMAVLHGLEDLAAQPLTEFHHELLMARRTILAPFARKR